MILGLFTFLAGVSLVLVLLGLFRPNESGFALIGFALFFILSLIILNGTLEIESGANVSSSFGYDLTGNINTSSQELAYDYTYWHDSTSRQFGFWMAAGSTIGFIWLLFAIRRGKNEE